MRDGFEGKGLESFISNRKLRVKISVKLREGKIIKTLSSLILLLLILTACNFPELLTIFLHFRILKLRNRVIKPSYAK